MIGRLKGIVEAIGESHCILDVNGVGYDVACSARTLRALKAGEPATLSIDTHVREDAIRLYGFTSELERAWFRLLQNVQGVGAKVALSVLGTLSPEELLNALATGDWVSVERTPGVGKKLAQRIVTEMKDKAPAGVSPSTAVRGSPLPAADGKGGLGPASAEAISALTNLGYPPAQASTAIAAALKELGPDADTARLIRRGLKELSR